MNKMKNLKYSLFLFLIISVVGCDEDRFSSVKTIEFPEHESQLAVTSRLFNADPNGFTIQTPRAFISNSLGILDQSEYDKIEGATVKLYKDENLFFDFNYDETSKYYLGPNTIEFTEGNYRLEVDAPNYDPVSATQTMPNKAEVLSSTFETEKVPFDFEEQFYDLLKIKIKDEEGVENYYGFVVTVEYREPNGNIFTDYPYAFSDDPLFEGGSQINEVLPDISFDGKNYDVRLLLQTFWQTQNGYELVAINVDVITMTKDMYFYETTMSLNYEADENPFAEPVLVHSNVEGGYGIFTLHNSTRYRHEL